MLDEPIEDLSSEFLEQANNRLQKLLEDLDHFSNCQVSILGVLEFRIPIAVCYRVRLIPLQDMLEFMELGCSGFLNDLCITVATYNDLFTKNFSV